MPSDQAIRRKPSWLPWFGGALGVALVLDLLSKYLLFNLVSAADGLPHWLIRVYNPGVAWSLFADHPWLVVGLTFVLIPVLGVVWWQGYRTQGRSANVAFGLVLGGALGNAWDRSAMALGKMPGVRDFIHVDLGFWPLNPWPTFNIADSAICVGFVLLVVLPWFQPRTGDLHHAV